MLAIILLPVVLTRTVCFSRDELETLSPCKGWFKSLFRKKVKNRDLSKYDMTGYVNKHKHFAQNLPGWAFAWVGIFANKNAFSGKHNVNFHRRIPPRKRLHAQSLFLSHIYVLLFHALNIETYHRSETL